MVAASAGQLSQLARVSPALSALARSLNELQPPAPRKALGASMEPVRTRRLYNLGTCACNTGWIRWGHASAVELSHARATARLDLNRDADDGVAAPHATQPCSTDFKIIVS